MKTVVLGLDGFPFTLARRLGEEGTMPNLARLAREGCLAQMDSILPTVSNVAWTSYQTGKNPGGFGVFGFAELTREFELHIPNSADCKALSLQEILSRAGKKVISLGIPGSYPPRPVEGINVGGFLSPSLAKAVYPASALPKLEATGYRLDIDPMKARESLEYFKKENLEVFEGRVGTLFRLWDSEPWDYLAVHFMDTDRLMHFMFKYIDPEGDEGENRDYCRDFFRRIDAVIGRVADKLDADTRLIVLSDHGFCRIRKEVQLNRWLQDRGYLTFSRPPAHDLDFEAVAPGARAIALVPGKIYILEEGKWARGGVKPGEYGELREEIVRKLKGLAEIGRPICKKVYRR
ncbi:MAG TPA: alkaline phosphatase family protein, partial [bacterium]|nr:alkaline phosphatase family protein [bacterium]